MDLKTAAKKAVQSGTCIAREDYGNNIRLLVEENGIAVYYAKEGGEPLKRLENAGVTVEDLESEDYFLTAFDRRDDYIALI